MWGWGERDVYTLESLMGDYENETYEKLWFDVGIAHSDGVLRRRSWVVTKYFETRHQ